MAAGVDRLRRHRPGSRRYTAATCFHGFHHRQRRRLFAAPHPHAEPSPPQPGAAAPQFVASPVRSGEDLPSQLPPGAHRAISTLAAAQMRKMMEGVVLFGTGKSGTTRWIFFRRQDRHGSEDRSRHAHLFENHAHRVVCRLRAGQLSRHRRGSRPRFAQGAVLWRRKSLRRSSPRWRSRFSNTSASSTISIFALLTWPPRKTYPSPKTIPPRRKKISRPSTTPLTICPATIRSVCRQTKRLRLPTLHRRRPRILQPPKPAQLPGPPPSAPAAPHHESAPSSPANTVVIADAGKLRVPSLTGLPIREIIEQAAGAGLQVEITGDGIAREQAPAPGTMVPPGTKIVVRCAR